MNKASQKLQRINSSGKSIEHWKSVIGQSLVDLNYQKEKAGLFNWQMDMYSLSDVQIGHLQFDPHIIQRKQKIAIDGDNSEYLVTIQTEGIAEVIYGENSMVIKPGDFMMFDANSDYSICFPNSSSQLVLKIPALLFDERIKKSCNMTGNIVSGESGIGGLFYEYCQSVYAKALNVESSMAPVITRTLLDLLASSYAFHSQAAQPLKLNSSVLLRDRLKQFIDTNIQNSELNVTILASTFNISARAIHKAFKDDNYSVNRYIWSKRLENCKLDLVNPDHYDWSISQIAFFWGFNELSHFYRLFSESYGMAPGAFRKSQIRPNE